MLFFFFFLTDHVGGESHNHVSASRTRESKFEFSPEVAAYILPNYKLDSDYLKTIAAVQALSGDAMPELSEKYSECESLVDSSRMQSAKAVGRFLQNNVLID